MRLDKLELHHLPFFDALTRDTEGSPEWRAAAAGLVTLRLFDQWVDDGYTLTPTDLWGWAAVRDAVYSMDPTSPARTILEGIVAVIRMGNRGEAAGVESRFIAYGRALHYEGRFDLAADVFRSVAAHAAVNEPELTIDATMQLGYCYRVLGEWEKAADAYSRAGSLATLLGDRAKQLRARIADAKISIDLGNLPAAESILDDTIARASTRELSEVRGIAMHDRGDVAFRRGYPADAVELVRQALDILTDASARDRAVADLGTYFLHLGMRDAARDAHLIVAHTARAQYSRWVATINLLEIAALDRCEPVFEQYRKQLADVALPPALRASYLLYVGRGCQSFDRLEVARATLEQAAEVATRYRLSQIAFEIDEELAVMARGATRANAPAPAPAEIPATLHVIAGEIAEMRCAALAAR